MKKLEDILNSLVLPIKLPAEVFVLFGKKRKIPDFEMIFDQVLPELIRFLEPNGTARTSERNIYLFPLLEDGHLVVGIKGQAIIEILYLPPCQRIPESVRKLLSELKN